jgi:hypothetical protein
MKFNLATTREFLLESSSLRKEDGMDYSEFLGQKLHHDGQVGFAPKWMPEWLFDYQLALTEWAILQGKAALFADCGLGKTPMQLVWAENVVRQANKPVLILTPLAVGAQTIREAKKFGIEAARSGDGMVRSKIVVTNYERLHHFDPNEFIGVVCDESSILKNFEGATRTAVTEFLRKMPYRLLCTATASPNDYIEFGTHSEALGGLGYMDMLGMFFKNDQNSLHPMSGRFAGSTWRFKAHAERPFWRWLCSWARAIRKPSDYGFQDAKFQLPQLNVQHHVVNASRALDGYLFAIPAVGLEEQRAERKATIKERCERVAELVSHTQSAVAWCNLNAEGDVLEEMIPDAVQVSGKDSDERKEEVFEAFANGEIRVLVTKSVIAGFGLNWQHCHQMTFFPSHSFEQYYQAVRRCWRFGQTAPVTVDIVTTEGESDVMRNLDRKAQAAEKAFAMIVGEMNNELHLKSGSTFAAPVEAPSWL